MSQRRVLLVAFVLLGCHHAAPTKPIEVVGGGDSIDAGDPPPPPPPPKMDAGTCGSDLDQQGCPCPGESATRSCFTGDATMRGVNACKDGTQKCERSGEFFYWAACLGSVTQCGDCAPGAQQACYTGPMGSEGVGICMGGTQTCDSAGAWGACNNQVLPLATEICGDTIDDDCNGLVDCQDPACHCVCMPGTTQACYTGPQGTEGVGPCKGGTQSCDNLGQWGPCNGEVKPSAEQCTDMTDNDCDGQADCYDADCHCDCIPGSTQTCYDGPAGTDGVGVCHSGTKTCGMFGTWGACTGEVVPGSESTTAQCTDNSDNDCDGKTDCLDPSCGCDCLPGTTASCYDGPAATNGVGPCHGGTKTCSASGKWGACMGQVLPGSESAQCTDNVDNDCDGQTDCHDTNCPACCMPSSSDIVLTPNPADVLFIVDRSASMLTQDAGGLTRWDALTSAMQTVLPPLDNVLYMGLELFEYGGFCQVPSWPNVTVRSPSAGSINSWLSSITPDGNTPTYQALWLAGQYVQSYTPVRPQYLVLSTDGDPNCGYTTADVVDLLGQIHSILGVDTFVLGIPGGDASLASNLNQMAVAGGRPRSGTTKFYPATSPSSFQAALRGITAAATNCSYPLSAAPPNPNNVTVKFDGTSVPKSSTNGWSYSNATTIKFNGSSCTQLTSGNVTRITINEGC